MIRGHEQLDHTADLALRVWAPTEEALLVQAATALVEMLTESAALEANATRRVHVNSIDAADRLVQWLNEILVLAIHGGFIFVDAHVSLRDDGLDAEVRGELCDASRIQTELKSVTYHDLRLDRDTVLGFVAQVVIDV